MRGRAFWSLSDQALSSLTNAGLSIVVARAVGGSSFGAFSLALVTFSFVVGIGRATIAEVFVIRFSAVSDGERWAGARTATGAAAVLGALAGVLCGLAALVVRDAQTQEALVALGIALPGLLVQDCFRFIFFAAGQPRAAAINDLIWTVIQFSLISLLITLGWTSIFLITLAWGIAALAAAIAACLQARILPSPSQYGHWFSINRDLNVRMGMEYAINMGAVNLSTYMISGIVGLLGVGALRAAQVLLGPLQLLSSGLGAFILPLFATRVAGGRDMLRPALLTSGVMTTVSGAWVAALLLIPESGGRQLLGESWDGARTVMLASGLMMIIIATTIGPALALRALQRADHLLRVSVIQAPFILVLGVAGAYWKGAVGAAQGYTVAQVVGAVVIWMLLLRADRAPRPDGPVLGGDPNVPRQRGRHQASAWNTPASGSGE